MAGMEIDLDAAERDVLAEEPVVIFGGEKFTLPPRPSWKCISAMGTGNIDEALDLLLGEQAPAFWAKNPSDKHVKALLEGIQSAYGLDVGESEASGD